MKEIRIFMKINKIEISSFGKLSNYTLDLSDGLCVIYGNNEDGKTTLAAFIKAVFYGTGTGKAKSLEDLPRTKYRPWNGSDMGGRIYFTFNGTDYCIERLFRGSNSTDRIVLTNTDLGEAENVSSDIGERFFGINAEAFEKSAFISSFVSGISSSAAGELNSKLSSIALTGDESTSFKTVSDRITRAYEGLISKSKKAGACIKSKEKLTALEAEYEKALSDAKKRSEISEEVFSLKAQIKSNEKRLGAIKKLLSYQEDAKKAEKLREYIDKKCALDKIKSAYPSENGRPIDIKSVEFCLSKAKAAEGRYELFKSEAEKTQEEIRLSESMSTQKAEEELERLNSEVEEKKEKLALLEPIIKSKSDEKQEAENKLNSAREKKKALNLPLLIAGILLAAVSAVIFAVLRSAPLSVILLALAVTVGSSAFILKPKNKRLIVSLNSSILLLSSDITALCAQKSELISAISEINGKKSIISSAVSADTAIAARREKELEEKLSEAEKAKADIAAAKSDLNAILGSYCDTSSDESITAAIEEIRDNFEKIKQLKTELMYLSNDLNGISYEEARQKLDMLSTADIQSIDFAAAETEKAKLEELLSQLKLSSAQKETELKTGFRGFKAPEAVAREIAYLKESILSMEQFCSAAAIANEALKESFAEVRKSYGSEMEKRTLEIFSKLTGGRYGRVAVSKELEISVEQADIFGTKEIDYLSRGTVEQAYLSLRLAISELISKSEPLPIIMDDVLSQYDDSRARAALEFLADYSRNTQCILLTCHGFIADTAKNCGFTIKQLNS